MWLLSVLSFILFFSIIQYADCILRPRPSFAVPPHGCEYDQFDIEHKPNFTSKCLLPLVQKFDISHSPIHGNNVFLFGNSVIRHYSFSILGIANGNLRDISMNRTEEKTTCTGELGDSSCTHYSVKPKTLISFFWKQNMGEITCEDFGRDACARVDLQNTTQCLSHIFKSATDRDVLIVGSIPADAKLWCDKKYTSTVSFEAYFDGLTKPDVMVRARNAAMVEKVMRLFPGRILWVSYPYLRNAAAVMNQQISSVNKQVSQAVAAAAATEYAAASSAESSELAEAAVARDDVKHLAWTDKRVQYVNLEPLQREYLHSYIDFIHHPGVLSELIIKYLLSILA
jgi:hypothetical protein